ASSTDELTDIAKKSLEADKIDKTQKISSEMSKGEDILSNKMSDLEYETDTTAKELQKLLEEKKNAVLSDAVDKGVARSSIVEEAQNEVEAEYGQNEKQLLEKKTNQLNQLTEQLNQLYARTQLALEALSKSHDAEVSEKVRALLAENIKKQDEVTKYNNTVEANEQKYQSSAKQATQKAKENELRRVADILKLKSQVGETGVTEQTVSEELSTIKDFFKDIDNKTAVTLIKSSGAMQSYLGKYYDYLLTYISNR
ncbi:MAG: hypothetical protein RR086_05755, partial [Clostridia bacterium]